MNQTREHEITVQAQESLNYIITYLKKEELYIPPILFRVGDIQDLLTYLNQSQKGA